MNVSQPSSSIENFHLKALLWKIHISPEIIVYHASLFEHLLSAVSLRNFPFREHLIEFRFIAYLRSLLFNFESRKERSRL